MKIKIICVAGFVFICFASLNDCFAKEKLIWSFEKKEDIEKWGSQYNAKIEQVKEKEYVTNGEYSAKITFPPQDYPGIFIYPEIEDWSDYLYFSFDFYNPGKEVFGPAIQISDDQGESILFYMGISGGENLSYKKRLSSIFKTNTKFNPQRVKKLSISIGPREKEQIVYMDNIRLEPVSETLFKLPILSDFETEEDLSKWGYIGVSIQQSKDYVSQKDYGGKITFLSKGGEWCPISCYLENGTYSKDWSGYEKFAFDIFNPNQEVFNFAIVFANFDQGDTKYKSKTFYYGVEGQKEKEAEFSIADMSKEIDITHVSSFGVTIKRPEKDTVIYVDNFRLIPKEKELKTGGDNG